MGTPRIFCRRFPGSFPSRKRERRKTLGQLESVKKIETFASQISPQTEPKLCVCPVFARPHCRRTVPDCTTRHLGTLGRSLGSDIFLVHHQGNVKHYYFSLSSAARTEHHHTLCCCPPSPFGRRAPPSRGCPSKSIRQKFAAARGNNNKGKSRDRFDSCRGGRNGTNEGLAMLSFGDRAFFWDFRPP